MLILMLSHSLLIFILATLSMILLHFLAIIQSKMIMFSHGQMDSSPLYPKFQSPLLILVESIVKDLPVKTNVQPKNGAINKEEKFLEIFVSYVVHMKKLKTKDVSQIVRLMKFLLMEYANVHLVTLSF